MPLPRGTVEGLVMPIGWYDPARAPAVDDGVLQVASDWFATSSAGALRFTFTVAPPVSVARPADYCDSGFEVASAAADALLAPAFSSERYPLRIYVLPDEPCDWAGRAHPLVTSWDTGPWRGEAWMDGDLTAADEAVLIHELGHTLGLDHAHATPSAVFADGDPFDIEYGSPISVMGRSWLHPDLGPYEKAQLSWATVVRARASSRLQLPLWEGPDARAIMIATPTGAYWPELRRRVGLDLGIPSAYDGGVAVVRSSGFEPPTGLSDNFGTLLSLNRPLRAAGDAFVVPGMFTLTLASPPGMAAATLDLRWSAAWKPVVSRLRVLRMRNTRLDIAWSVVADPPSIVERIDVTVDGRTVTLTGVARSWIGPRVRRGLHRVSVKAVSYAGIASTRSAVLRVR